MPALHPTSQQHICSLFPDPLLMSQEHIVFLCGSRSTSCVGPCCRPREQMPRLCLPLPRAGLPGESEIPIEQSWLCPLGALILM